MNPTRREAVLGIPENVQATVDVLLGLEKRGPVSLDKWLASLTPEQTVAALRALLGRHNARKARTVREAQESLIRGELADERRQILRGGGR